MFQKIYALITMPGVVVHELAHLFFCLFSGTKIYKVRLFRFGNPAGYVNHGEPNKFWKAFIISFGPLVVNSVLTLFLFALVKPPYYSGVSILYLWLAIAIGLHAIPSTGDARSLFSMANHKIWKNPFVIISYPFILVLWILNLLKRLKINAAYVVLLFWLANFYL